MTIVAIHHSSPQGAAALTAARNLSRERNDELVVLAAGSGSDAPGAADLEGRVFTEQVHELLGDKTQWQAELIAPGPDPVEAIIEHIRTIEPDVVVLGTRHRSTLGKMFLGHDVHRYLLDIEFPILLVKPPQH